MLKLSILMTYLGSAGISISTFCLALGPALASLGVMLVGFTGIYFTCGAKNK